MVLFVILSAFAAEASELVAGEVELVADGFQFVEGPVWLPSGELVFTDIPADTIFRPDKSVFRKPSGKANGLTLDQEGRLIACEHWNRRVTRTESDGTITVLADNYEGKKFNSPNDAIVRSDGTVFFTDPPYGLEGREAEIDFSGVYAVAPDGKVSLLVQDFNRPNGIALSPDAKTLYVADSAAGHIRAFDVADDGTVSNGREFSKIPGPDGMAIDVNGNVWCTSSEGVLVFNPQGTTLTTITFPQVPANCGFGGDDMQTLYATARTGLYQVRTAVPGLKLGGKSSE